MRRLDGRGVPQHRLQRGGVPPPQHSHQRLTPCHQGPDGAFGDGLPAFTPVRRRFARTHCQHPVEQHHTLVRPGCQVTAGGRGVSEVSAIFGEDVGQAAWQPPNVGRHRETQPDGVTRRRIGVLADDQHPHLVQRKGEGPQDVRAGRQIAMSCGQFGAQEFAHRCHLGLDRLQGVGPGLIDQLGKWACRHDRPT